jgi:alpha/beta superfamily hydrolase
MVRPSENILIDGPVGPLQTLVDQPDHVRGLAIVAHPHPLFGGANNNKVVYTLAHTLRDLGHVVLRPNFRGVGKSAGTHDGGRGETDDLLAVLDHAIARWDAARALPVVLAGFSFGAFVQTQVAKRLEDAGRPPFRLILVGTAAGEVEGTRSYDPPAVPRGSLLIHGDRDEVVPLANVLRFAEAHGLAVTVIAGADHFFHGRLPSIREVVERSWKGAGY